MPNATRRPRTRQKIDWLINCGVDEVVQQSVRAKQVYRAARQLQSRESVRVTRGRVQLLGRKEYAHALRFSEPLESRKMLVADYPLPATVTPQNVPEHRNYETIPWDEWTTWIPSGPSGTPVFSSQFEEIVCVLQHDPGLADRVFSFLETVTTSEHPVRATVLESFDGFVDQIDGDTAYVTLKSEHGDTLHGVYPAAKLAARGIKERRRFTCQTVDRGGRVEVELAAISDVDVSPEEQQVIANRITKIFGSGSLEGDY